MRPLKRLLVLSLLLAPLVPLSLFAGSAAALSCSPLPRQETAELPAGKYLRVYGNVAGTRPYYWVEIWTETNGEPGLQTYKHSCAAGDFANADFRNFQFCTESGGSSLYCVVYL